MTVRHAPPETALSEAEKAETRRQEVREQKKKDNREQLVQINLKSLPMSYSQARMERVNHEFAVLYTG